MSYDLTINSKRSFFLDWDLPDFRSFLGVSNRWYITHLENLRPKCRVNLWFLSLYMAGSTAGWPSDQVNQNQLEETHQLDGFLGSWRGNSEQFDMIPRWSEFWHLITSSIQRSFCIWRTVAPCLQHRYIHLYNCLVFAFHWWAAAVYSVDNAKCWFIEMLLLLPNKSEDDCVDWSKISPHDVTRFPTVRLFLVF